LIAAAVEDRNDSNLSFRYAIKHAVGEPLHDRPANVLEDTLMDFRQRGDPIQDLLGAGRELVAKTGTLLFIPIMSLVEFRPSRAPEYDW